MKVKSHPHYNVRQTSKIVPDLINRLLLVLSKHHGLLFQIKSMRSSEDFQGYEIDCCMLRLWNS